MNRSLEQANWLYVQAVQHLGGMSEANRLKYLERSVQIYRKNFETVPPGEKSALLKNMGMAHFRSAQILRPTHKTFHLLLYHLSEALWAFGLAWVARADVDRVSSWGARITELVSDCYQRALNSSKKCIICTTKAF